MSHTLIMLFTPSAALCCSGSVAIKRGERCCSRSARLMSALACSRIFTTSNRPWEAAVHKARPKKGWTAFGSCPSSRSFVRNVRSPAHMLSRSCMFILNKDLCTCEFLLWTWSLRVFGQSNKRVHKRCADRSVYTKSNLIPNDTAESFETCLRTHLLLLKAPSPMRCFVAKVGWPIAIPCAPCQEGGTHPTPAKMFNIYQYLSIDNQYQWLYYSSWFLHTIGCNLLRRAPNFAIFPPLPIRPRYHGRTIAGGTEVCLSWGSKETGASNLILVSNVMAAWASGRLVKTCKDYNSLSLES